MFFFFQDIFYFIKSLYYFQENFCLFCLSFEDNLFYFFFFKKGVFSICLLMKTYPFPMIFFSFYKCKCSLYCFWEFQKDFRKIFFAEELLFQEIFFMNFLREKNSFKKKYRKKKNLLAEFLFSGESFLWRIFAFLVFLPFFRRIFFRGNYFYFRRKIFF